MTFAATNRVLLGIKQESTWGTWPAGNINAIRYTAETFGQNLTTVISNEVRSDRQVADIIRTAVQAVGGWNGEMSYDVTAFELALKGILGASADFASPPAAITASLAAVASGNKITTDSTGTGTDFSTSAFAVGSWVRLSGFTAAANNGYFQISARNTTTPAAHEITLVGGTLTNESVASRTIQSSATIRNGTTAWSFSGEKQFLDLNSGSGLAARIAGIRFGGLDLTLTPEQIATYSVTGQGKAVQDTATPATDLTASTATPDFTNLSTVTASATNDIMSTGAGIGDIILNRDTPLTGVTVNSFNSSIQTALRRQTGLGSGIGALGIGIGRMTLGGSLVAYFEDTQLLNKHLLYVDTDFAIVTRDGAGNAYLWDFPAIKLGGDGLPKGTGNDQDAIINLTVEGKRSTRYSLDYTVGVSKFAA